MQWRKNTRHFMNPDDTAAEVNLHPFRVFCPSCGADSDAEDQVLTYSVPALPPHTDFALGQIECLTCNQKFDICFWPVDHTGLIRSLAAKGEPYDFAAPEVRGLLAGCGKTRSDNARTTPGADENLRETG